MAEEKSNQATVVAIKPQYIFREETGVKDEDEDETPDKRLKLDDNNTEVPNDKFHEKKRFQRTPQQRFRYPEGVRPVISEMICRTLVNVGENEPMPVCDSFKCKCLHDVAKFLEVKPPDIGEECHIYSLKGHCQYGISCRYAKKHITETGRNKTNEIIKTNYEEHEPKTLEFYNKDLDNELKKRTYDFKKSCDVLDQLPKPPVPAGPLFTHFAPFRPTVEIDFTEDIDVPSPKKEVIPPLVPELEKDEPIGPCPDEDLFKEHLNEKKKIDWTNKLYLAPVSCFGNLPFRRICKEFGADVTCSETAVATALIQGHGFEWLLTRRHENEDLFGVRISGNNPYVLTRCAQLLEEQTTIDFLDIQLASPIEPVFRPRHILQTRREKLMETVIRCVSRVTNLPVTVNTRVGDYSDEKIIARFIPNYQSCQVSLVTIRGRSGIKDSKGVIDWDYINKTAGHLSPVPVFGLSDVFSYHDYQTLRVDNPNVAGVQLSRGAVCKPWLFTEIKQQREWDISSSERFDMLKKFVNYGLEHWGSDTRGVEATRRFLLDWLSLLCRYIPIGLLENPPQKINDKPPKYIGRNELETLMASNKPSDWIKISEMLLGPVPKSFMFTPKIRPYSWPHDS